MLIFCVLLDQLLSQIIFGQLCYYKFTFIKKYNKPLQKSETKVFKKKKKQKKKSKKKEKKKKKNYKKLVQSQGAKELEPIEIKY